MEVERIQRQGHVFYRIHSDYAKDSVTTEPKELMQLLTWLQAHENEIVNDALANSTHDEMKGL
jgi:hypothetical protein